MCTCTGRAGPRVPLRARHLTLTCPTPARPAGAADALPNDVTTRCANVTPPARPLRLLCRPLASLASRRAEPRRRRPAELRRADRAQREDPRPSRRRCTRQARARPRGQVVGGSPVPFRPQALRRRARPRRERRARSPGTRLPPRWGRRRGCAFHEALAGARRSREPRAQRAKGHGGGLRRSVGRLQTDPRGEIDARLSASGAPLVRLRRNSACCRCAGPQPAVLMQQLLHCFVSLSQVDE